MRAGSASMPAAARDWQGGNALHARPASIDPENSISAIADPFRGVQHWAQHLTMAGLPGQVRGAVNGRRLAHSLKGPQLEALPHLEGVKAVGVPQAELLHAARDQLHGIPPPPRLASWDPAPAPPAARAQGLG